MKNKLMTMAEAAKRLGVSRTLVFLSVRANGINLILGFSEKGRPAKMLGEAAFLEIAKALKIGVRAGA